MSNVGEPQGTIVARILGGAATVRDVEIAAGNFARWLTEQWKGSAERALAYCVNSLSTAFDGVWDALPERDQQAHLWLFTFLCPQSLNARGEVDFSALDHEAEAYAALVHANGGCGRFAQRIRRVRGEE
ncbi:hypothetical protein GCM10010492_67160 [Saccharothrix mutabilis subsp. mutabilis]|uniref:Uncharacterized protein n=1 Tax=Saccharothrix mutabilis subsp. mutabilis TaxID=66855 RepID=A0ABN0UNV4_9PSEU